MRARGWVVAGGTVLGVVLGWLASWRLGEHHRRSLFNPSPLRRWAALRFLARHSGVESVGLLRDYVVWEPKTILRRRAFALLKRLEARYAH